MNALKRHAYFYLTFALEHGEDTDWFDTEWEQIQHAWSAIKEEQSTLCLAYLKIFDVFLDGRSLWADEIEWAKLGIEIAERMIDRRHECFARNLLGSVLSNKGEVEK